MEFSFGQPPLILERFQSKVLRLIAVSPGSYQTNFFATTLVHAVSVKQEIKNYSNTYFQKLGTHPNSLVTQLRRRICGNRSATNQETLGMNILVF